jgi:protein-tyrosine-phosphatase
VNEIPVVVFLCIHNSGRSLAARVLLEHLAQGRIEVLSAGSEPGEQLNPAVVAVLSERGLTRPRSSPSLSPTRSPAPRT